MKWLLFSLYISTVLSFIQRNEVGNKRINFHIQIKSLQARRDISSPFITTKDNPVLTKYDEYISKFKKPLVFLSRAGLIGVATGFGVVVMKSLIFEAQELLYEGLANVLPKPAFYWPIAFYPIIGATLVSVIGYLYGPSVWEGLDFIAKTIDYSPYSIIPTETSVSPEINQFPDVVTEIEQQNIPQEEKNTIVYENISNEPISSVTTTSIDINEKSREIIDWESAASQFSGVEFRPLSLVMRLFAAVSTLGSGCSLGPEGPSVEIGAAWSRICASSETDTTLREKHHLFLAGTAAGVAAGFGAPIAGVFFALECGNRCLARNTIRLDEDASDAPRSDIAAIVLAATMSNIIVQLFLQHRETLLIQGNSYAMISPFFELPVYFGLAVISGIISVVFDVVKSVFSNFYKIWDIPKYYRPLLGGLLCGIVAIFYPQTLFNGYATLEELLSHRLSSNTFLDFLLLLQLLSLKLVLSSFSLVSGLVGGVFAPSLFFGATAGTAYHYIVSNVADDIRMFILNHSQQISILLTNSQDFYNHITQNAASVLSDTTLLAHSMPIHDPNTFDSSNAWSGSLSSIISTSDNTAPPPSFMLRSLMTKQWIDKITTFFTISNVQAYATVGAAATLGAMFRAPLTSSMLMFELTQNHDIVLPVLFSTGLGGFFADLIRKFNITNIS